MRLSFFFVMGILLVSACSMTGQPGPAEAGTLQVVTTTNILADVVRQVGGEQLTVTSVLPVGADPHAFEPTPQDVVNLSRADIVFLNGLGLEGPLQDFLQTSGTQTRLVTVSDGVQPLPFAGEADHLDGENGEEIDQQDGSADPHVWFDPQNVILWVERIEAELSQLDPAHAGEYQANAAAYRAKLEELDAWIGERTALVPQENREIVTDHVVFGYFAKRYGFRQVGTLVPGASTVSEPSAQELAALEDRIRELGVKAVFVGNTVNPSLAQQVAEDTGVQVIILYTGSLTEAGSEAGTYLDYMRYNVNAIVEALK